MGVNPLLLRAAAIAAIAATAAGGSIGLAAAASGRVDAKKVTWVSYRYDGLASNGQSYESRTSDDGKLVVFFSDASDMISGVHSWDHIILNDRDTGASTLIDRAPDGTPGEGGANAPDISGDGRYIVYDSAAANLVPGDTNSQTDVFVLDRTTGVTEMVSHSADGGPTNAYSGAATISDDGRYVAFASDATNLVKDGISGGHRQIYVTDRTTGRTVIASSGVSGPGDSDSFFPEISADGATVAYESEASNLTAQDDNEAMDVFAYKVPRRSIELVSATADGFFLP